MKKYLPKVHYSTILYVMLCFYGQWYKESLMLFGIIFIHEYSHLLVAQYFNYDIDSITIYPFGAFLKLNDYGRHENREDLMVASAGLVSHLLLLTLGYFFKDNLGMHLYRYFIQFNLQVFFFNILPIYPMDGSKILLCLLSYGFDYLLSLKLILIISFMTLCLLMFFSFHINFLWAFIFLWFQLFSFSQNYYYEYLQLLMFRKDDHKRKPYFHKKPIFMKNKQNYYVFNGQILDEKSFIKSRFFIDNTSL